MFHLLNAIWWWMEVHTGTVNESGPYYGFWSGFGSDLGELTLIGFAGTWYKVHKCDRCPRLSRHDVPGTHYSVCHHHFTVEHMGALQRKHQLRFPEQHELMNRNSTKVTK